MKAFLLLFTFLFSATAIADEYVNGYTRSDGQYVQGHYKTEANDRRWDNYSSQGNTNPYTGERGYKSHEYSNPWTSDSGSDSSRKRRSSYR